MPSAVPTSGRTEAGERSPAACEPQGGEPHRYPRRAEAPRRWWRHAPLFFGIAALAVAAVGGGAGAFFAAFDNSANGLHGR
ncbi:MAG: hypothetical protein R3D62_22080, partial [Xanthobacteraceae bacterium]